MIVMSDFWRMHVLASRNGTVGLHPRYLSEEYYGISLPWSIGFAGVNFFDTVEAYTDG
jgi:hypothetical protein